MTARAGKDLISCLVSGLLTIGPRFGGAIDDAARYFKGAADEVRGRGRHGAAGRFCIMLLQAQVLCGGRAAGCTPEHAPQGLTQDLAGPDC